MSEITPKQLHDALHIIRNDRVLLEARLQVSLTDITDSDEGFARRIDNLREQVAELTAKRDQLTHTITVLDADIARMAEVRSLGHAALEPMRAMLKKLELNEKTIQLALLQIEASNAS